MVKVLKHILYDATHMWNLKVQNGKNRIKRWLPGPGSDGEIGKVFKGTDLQLIVNTSHTLVNIPVELCYNPYTC